MNHAVLSTRKHNRAMGPLAHVLRVHAELPHQTPTLQNKDLSYGSLDTTAVHPFQQLTALLHLARNHIHAQLLHAHVRVNQHGAEHPIGRIHKTVSGQTLGLRTSSVGPHLLAASSLYIQHAGTGLATSQSSDQHAACCNLLGRQSTTR
jgi:hypothetical protein